MKEITLPSGAVLKMTHTPFAVSKALYQAILEEMKGLKMSHEMEVSSVLKEIFCIGFSSKKVETALWECLKRCTYNNGAGDLKIDDTTFEPIAAREDYSLVCIEVMRENISPFMKGLYAELPRILAMITGSFPK